MEISRRQSLTLDFDSAALLSYPSTHPNCGNCAYDARGMKPMALPKVADRFVMTGSASMDNGVQKMLTPKRENIFSQLFTALTSGVMERLAKVPTSFMNNMNTTLSVTVVPNEGIISQEFFKSLTQSCEQLVTDCDAGHNDIMKLSNGLSNKCLNTKSQISHVFTNNFNEEILSTKLSSDGKEIAAIIGDKIVREELDVRIDDPTTEMFSMDEDDRASVDWTEAHAKKSHPSKPEVVDNPTRTNITKESCSTGWQTMWEKVANLITDRPNRENCFPEPEVPTKKPNLAVYPHVKPRRKICTVARVRGKGRGKSQLRRSGVSQSSLRKERTRQNIYSDIQDDLEAFDDYERNDVDNEDSTLDLRNYDERHDLSTIYQNFTFDEITKLRRREKIGENDIVELRSRAIAFVPKTSMEMDEGDAGGVDEQDRSTKIDDVRPRLVSESSIDSEDSYCIVFENNSTSDYDDYDYDTDTDEDSDDVDFDEDDKTTTRVRFNLEPQVRTMVQWNFAYRAARRGPWEQMARDRERFRGRIRGIERVLEPILSPQHRKCVWKNRFDVDG